MTTRTSRKCLSLRDVWQMAELFGRDRSVITKHIRNIFSEGELDIKSNVQNMHIANSDKPITLYNLDVMYRQVLDLYATSLDYNAAMPETIEFFKIRSRPGDRHQLRHESS